MWRWKRSGNRWWCWKGITIYICVCVERERERRGKRVCVCGEGPTEWCLRGAQRSVGRLMFGGHLGAEKRALLACDQGRPVFWLYGLPGHLRRLSGRFDVSGSWYSPAPPPVSTAADVLWTGDGPCHSDPYCSQRLSRATHRAGLYVRRYTPTEMVVHTYLAISRGQMALIIFMLPSFLSMYL